MKTYRLKWIIIASVSVLFFSANVWADGKRYQTSKGKAPHVTAKHHGRAKHVKPGIRPHRAQPSPRPYFRQPHRDQHHYRQPHGLNGHTRRHRVRPPAWNHRHHLRPRYGYPVPHHPRSHLGPHVHRPKGAGYLFSTYIVEPSIAFNFSMVGRW